ncbi:hypothetical protein WJX84_003068 [Apatococcus fuscideae]|uniref:AP2/ERF domain-containing protein n=1 Tax=Apatococcus fuscideae TaxID=2026836 RepID=A0AAW1TEY1_9CHLO
MGKSSAYRGVTLFRPTGKWRAQISAGGKTTSLGDHDTEIEAARAFDRAAINKAGSEAKTNFNMEAYADEIEDLQGMSQAALVAMLRSRARKSSTQTSHFRGVSLLKQTSKWHAQINVGGKQVHLGFFATEEQAARAYDRAAINKGARDNCKIITNFDINDYADELELLQRIGQDQLVAALASETFRRQTMAMLSGGFAGKAEEIFGEGARKKQAPPAADAELPKPGTDLVGLMLKAERAQPKPTARNPIYANFGKKAGTHAGRGSQKAHAAGASPSSTSSPLAQGSEGIGKRVRRPSSRLGLQRHAAPRAAVLPPPPKPVALPQLPSDSLLELPLLNSPSLPISPVPSPPFSPLTGLCPLTEGPSLHLFQPSFSPSSATFPSSFWQAGMPQTPTFEPILQYTGTDSETTEEDWSSDAESEDGNPSEAAKARAQRKERLERITAALAAARTARTAAPASEGADLTNPEDTGSPPGSWSSPEQRTADTKPLLNKRPLVPRALNFVGGPAQPGTEAQGAEPSSGTHKDVLEGEEAASDQTTGGVAAAPAAVEAAASSPVPSNEEPAAHPDELSLALDLQSLQDLLPGNASPEKTNMEAAVPVVMTKRHQRLIRPPRRLEDEPEPVSSRASRSHAAPASPASRPSTALPSPVSNKMAGTPLMEVVAALERAEGMQADGATAASSDPPFTPVEMPIIHPVDPLLAQSRPSTATPGKKRRLPKCTSPDETTPHRNRRVRQAPHRAA